MTAIAYYTLIYNADHLHPSLISTIKRESTVVVVMVRPIVHVVLAPEKSDLHHPFPFPHERKKRKENKTTHVRTSHLPLPFPKSLALDPLSLHRGIAADDLLPPTSGNKLQPT